MFNLAVRLPVFSKFPVKECTMTRFISRIITVQLVAVFFTISVLAPAARAAVIDTDAILYAQGDPARAEVQNFLAREDVRKLLTAYGVEPADADRRIAALTDSELDQLRRHINDLPAAGGEVLTVIGIVFLVLIILELVGVTNVFNKI